MLSHMTPATVYWMRKNLWKFRRGLLADFLRRKSAQFADLAGHFGHECRLIALAAMGNWSEVGRVGLDEHAVERNDAGGVANVLRLWDR